MTLTAVELKSVKPKDKDYKLSDEKGLYLLVKKLAPPTGVLNIDSVRERKIGHRCLS